MKRCPFCAEEIQDAAILCRFCNRTVSPTTTTTQARGALAPNHTAWITRVIWGVTIGLLAIMMVVAAFTWEAPPPRRAPAPKPPNLNVSAGRGGGGFALTNREPVTVSGCVVKVLDEGSDEWTGTIVRELEPYETRRLMWGSFEMGGQPMPSYVGLNRTYFTVSCLYGDTGALDVPQLL